MTNSARLALRPPVLTIDNYAAHMAGRQTIRQIEKKGKGHEPVDQYDWIVLPAADVPINIGGKLKAAGRSKVGSRMEQVIGDAEEAGMRCAAANASIVVCSRG